MDPLNEDHFDDSASESSHDSANNSVNETVQEVAHNLTDTSLYEARDDTMQDSSEDDSIEDALDNGEMDDSAFEGSDSENDTDGEASDSRLEELANDSAGNATRGYAAQETIETDNRLRTETTNLDDRGIRHQRPTQTENRNLNIPPQTSIQATNTPAVHGRHVTIHERCLTPGENHNHADGPCRYFTDMKHTQGSHPDREATCVICLDAIAPEASTMRHTGCKNSGCYKCVADCLGRDPRCPFCRVPLDPTAEFVQYLLSLSPAPPRYTDFPPPGPNDIFGAPELTHWVEQYRTIISNTLGDIRAIRDRLTLRNTQMWIRAENLESTQDFQRRHLEHVMRTQGLTLPYPTFEAVDRRLYDYNTLPDLHNQGPGYQTALAHLDNATKSLANAWRSLLTPEQLRQRSNGVVPDPESRIPPRIQRHIDFDDALPPSSEAFPPFSEAFL